MTRRSHAEGRLRSGARGFTLLELLVAMAVASLLLVILFSLITETMGVSRRTVQSLLAANSASTAMDIMAADLAGLMPLEGQGAYVFVGTETPGGATNACLRFLTVSPNNSSGGEAPRGGQPGFVAYRVARYDTDSLEVSASPANAAYALFRMTTNATDSFGEMGTNSIEQISTAPVMEADFFANNVVEFSVQMFRDGSAVPLPAGGLELRGDAPVGNARPDALLLTLMTLDENGAQRLRDGALSLDEVKAKYGRVLTRRIRLREGVGQ